MRGCTRKRINGCAIWIAARCRSRSSFRSVWRSG
jgi:hypothetical protein